MSAAVTLRRTAAWHPEAGAALAALLAWVALLATALGPAPIAAVHDAAHRSAGPLAAASGWLVMTVAMMVPGALPAARMHARGALWARRSRTVALFLGGYLALWAAFGVVGAAAIGGLRATGVGSAPLLAGTLLVAAGWELTRAKWRALRACHRHTPLPPRGRPADRACVRAGLSYGCRCVVACWAMMLAMLVAGHASLGLMVLLTVVVTAERVLTRPARFARPIAAALGAVAAVPFA